MRTMKLFDTVNISLMHMPFFQNSLPVFLSLPCQHIQVMKTELSRKLTQNVLTESLYFKAVIIKEEKNKTKTKTTGLEGKENVLSVIQTGCEGC